MRTTIRYATGVGRREPIPDQEVVFDSRGAMIATAESHDGAIECSAAGMNGPVGVRRASVTICEVEADVLRPGSRPLVLFDAMTASADLVRIATAAVARGFDVLAVRLRPIQSCRWIRARLMRVGLPPRVVDASAVLDEGSALDVGMNVDAVRLARVAARMRAAGFPVVAIAHCAMRTPLTIGFAALRAADLETARLQSAAAVSTRRSLAERLDDVTGTRSIGGNRIEVEIDNTRARRWLLDAIAAATRRIHLQLYMAADDDIGKMVEAALSDAARRGVKVCVVVDSLHGLEGSFGLHNPLLERLASHPGVELRLGGPINRPPSLEEFKQRDHRKIALFDGTLALLGGRNLSHEYYSGFAEVPLPPKSLWREVPWLDAGARVEGPAVAALEESFLDALDGRRRSSVRHRRAACRRIRDGSCRDASRSPRRAHAGGVCRHDRQRTVARPRRQRFSARPRDSARAAARLASGHPRDGTVREPDADARRTAVCGAMELGADRRHEPRAFANGHARHGGRRGV